MMRRGPVSFLVAAGLLLAAPAALPAASPRFESAKKTLTTTAGHPIEAVSGRLLVPENRAVADSRLIPVRFVRLASTAARPGPPLFYLAGGPGNRGASEHPRDLDFWEPFLAVSDLVLIDQRGVADTLLGWTWDGPLPLDYFRDHATARAHDEAMARRAGGVFRARGVDLGGYDTVESATDLEELRQALGLPRISLLAFSYGTHLAAAYLRAHGDVVENAVLIGTEGPDQTLKRPLSMDVQLARIGALAAADPAIARRVPDLVALYERVRARLDREPMIVEIEPAPGGEPLRLPIGSFGLDFILRADIGDASDLPVFPRLLWSIDRGDPSILTWFVHKRSGMAIRIGAMNRAMDCASGASPGRLALIADEARTSRFADVVNYPLPDAIASWGIPVLGDEFRAPLVSPVRTLFVSGELDFNAPPAQAEELKWGMAHATHLVVANAGHEQTFFQNETAIPVIVDFLRGEDVAGRRITSPPLRFIPLEGDSGPVGHPSLRR